MTPEQVNEFILDLLKIAEVNERTANTRRSDYSKGLEVGTAIGLRSAADMLRARLTGEPIQVPHCPDPWEVSA